MSQEEQLSRRSSAEKPTAELSRRDSVQEPVTPSVLGWEVRLQIVFLFHVIHRDKWVVLSWFSW